jgi:hypothetical protein
MPQLTKSKENPQLVEYRNWWNRFERAFSRSKKGNLYCADFNGLALTIFERGGRFWWSIAVDGQVSYSQCSYECETDAINALGYEIHE